MSSAPSFTTEPPAVVATTARSRGFWWESWRRFKRRKVAMAALLYVICLTLVALFSPAIAGTRPIVVRFQGHYYFPAMSYFNSSWENVVFTKRYDEYGPDGKKLLRPSGKAKQFAFRNEYGKSLKRADPESWAVWPLVYQDPYRRVKENEYPGVPDNPVHDAGHPSRQNLFGTTQLGVDVFAAMVHGTKTALLVGFVSMGIASALGISLGALAGYFGSFIDTILSRIIDVMMCVPTLVLILTALALLEKPTIWHIMAVIGFTGWTGIARLTRAEFLKLREADFVLAAKSNGAGAMRIMFRHILPNAMAPVLVPITFGIASAILTESTLSFLGLGSPPPVASWGELLNGARSNLSLWWLVVFPGGAVFLAVLAYNLVGDGLQDATNPRLRGD